jgi:hypothetical protein
MIVCDSFVFLHLHKSGGTFVNAMMMKCIASARRVGYHLPYAELPEACRHLPVLGTVRNPWSYYVSWYHFQQSQARPNPLFRICSEDLTLDFSGTIRNLLTLESDNDRIDRLTAAFPDHFVNYGLNLTKSCIEKIRGSGLGFYSFLHDRLYAGADAPRIIPMESLRETLHTVPLGLSPRETMLTRQFILSVPDLNVSDHKPHQHYYSPDLKALVAARDGALIERYGYAF